MQEIQKVVQRQTVQKTIVWKTIQSMNQHPCAEDVFLEVHKQYEQISRATVFRILNDLAIEGKIRRLHTPYGADCYDYKMEDHWHIQCSECGDLIDIASEKTNLSDYPSKMNGFEIKSFTIIYEGLCPECQKKENADSISNI
jgi:Fe2+ or Zn2+ uptake regulation protein